MIWKIVVYYNKKNEVVGVRKLDLRFWRNYLLIV